VCGDDAPGKVNKKNNGASALANDIPPFISEAGTGKYSTSLKTSL
jgi:hypothetical protein